MGEPYTGSTFSSSSLEVDISNSWQIIHSQELLHKLAAIDAVYELNKEKNLPLFIFRQGISPLQAIVKFLRENELLSFQQIALILGRDSRTVWTEYASVRNIKKFSNLELQKETVFISTSVVKSREYSVLESLCVSLKTRGYSARSIGLMLDKSPKTIWTVLARARKKDEKWGVAK